MKTFLFAVLALSLLVPAVPMAHPGHDHKLMGTISSIDKNKIVMKTTEGKDMTFEVVPTTTFKLRHQERHAGRPQGRHARRRQRRRRRRTAEGQGSSVPRRRRPPLSSDSAGQPASPKRSEGVAALAIAVKDATEIWRDGRFRWAAGLLLLLLVAAVAGGVHNQSQIARQHADAQQAERDVWLDKGDMNPHAAAHYGAFVFKPVQPLSAIDPGLDPFVGVFVFLEAHKQQLARHRPDRGRDADAAARTADARVRRARPVAAAGRRADVFELRRRARSRHAAAAPGDGHQPPIVAGRQGDWRDAAARGGDRSGDDHRRGDPVLERAGRSECADRRARGRHRRASISCTR